MTVQAKTAVPSAATNGKNGHSLISDAKFRQLYSLALRLQSAAEDSSGWSPGAAGLRRFAAALSGVAADLREGDSIFAGDAGPMGELLRDELRLRVDSASGVAAQERFAEGLSGAAGDRLRKNGRVTLMVFPAEEAENALPEAHAMASSARLPVIFVEEGSAEVGAQKRQRGRKAAAPVHAMPDLPVDAHDVIAMYRVAHESIARAREGSGPTRIVCLEAPLAAGHTADAVADLEGWLQARGLPAHAWRQEILATARSRKTA
ncbi:MAG TPA: thiamine pyrophosphate-dependent enzyme [Acidobacteriaceae bacterium]